MINLLGFTQKGNVLNLNGEYVEKKMCQQQIINYIRARGRHVDIQELIANIPANRASISRGCRKLRERKELKCMKKKIKNYEKFVYFL